MIHFNNTEFFQKLANKLSPKFVSIETFLGLVFLLIMVLKMFTDLPTKHGLILTTSILSLLYYLMAFRASDDPYAGAIERFVEKLIFQFLSVLVIGILFKLKHWPGNGVMLLMPSIALSVLFFYIMYTSIKKPELTIFNQLFKIRMVLITALGIALYLASTEDLVELNLLRTMP